MANFERALNIDPNYIDARKNLELARSLAEIKVDTETRQEIRWKENRILRRS